MEQGKLLLNSATKKLCTPDVNHIHINSYHRPAEIAYTEDPDCRIRSTDIAWINAASYLSSSDCQEDYHNTACHSSKNHIVAPCSMSSIVMPIALLRSSSLFSCDVLMRLCSFHINHCVVALTSTESWLKCKDKVQET